MVIKFEKFAPSNNFAVTDMATVNLQLISSTEGKGKFNFTEAT